MLKQMRSFLVIILFEWILTKPIEQSSRETFFISVPFILLLFLDVFRVSEDTTFIMMPTGNRFCVYSSWCSFEVFQMKGTREALTIQHCFYCLSLLYKQKMYFHFSCVSVMINQAGFIHTYSLFSDLWLTWKTCQASLSENSAHLKKIKIVPCLLACSPHRSDYAEFVVIPSCGSAFFIFIWLLLVPASGITSQQTSLSS